LVVATRGLRPGTTFQDESSTDEDKMPAVRINLYAGFRRKVGGQSSVDVSIEAGHTIEQLLGQLGVPLEETRIIFCNNRLADRTQELVGGETIGVFPAVGGG
jgi:molybdopterin converting factor small subunit